LSSILPSTWDWRSAIGNFILNFGSLDWSLAVFLEQHLPPDEFDRTKALHFKERAARVQALLLQGNLSDEKKASVDVFFKRLHKIRELRNLIAHGNPHLGPSNNGPALTIALCESRDLDPDPLVRRLTFDELSDACKELNDLIHEFDTVFAVWTAIKLQ
jgi:hypothetical protein